ncbi:hypothetical protein ABH930_005034 [Kitasatospora sp. GAS204A]|nr:hypothetical protein [Kitasatospora sp. GAS204B]
MTGMRRPGAEPLSAQWAVLGKRAGETMGYEVLGGSLPQARAGRWLWGAQTGTPAVRRGGGPDELPWRVFLSGVDGEQTAACAVVEHSWDGSLDGTGAPIITSRLLLLDWAQASGARITWSGLADAAAAVRWPRHQQDAPPLEPAAAPADAEALAAAVEDLGFDWAATVAALLLDGHLVVVTPTGRPLPPPDERVWLVDAIASLLPYGCRCWLSAATWSGLTDHQLTLSFAESARSAQTEVRYGEPAPELAPDAGAGRYLAELRRLRRKGFATVDLVRHLLGATTPLKWRDGAGAFRALREVDLVDSVVAEVQAGRGRVEDVGRVLALPDAAELDADRAGVLFRFLGRAAGAGGGDGRALELLRRHWRPELPRWLATDVLAESAAGPAQDRAMAALELVRELRGPGSPEFASLLGALVDPASTVGPQLVWGGALAWRAQQAFGAQAASADRVLVEHPELGRAWAQVALDHGAFDQVVLGRLLAAAQLLPLRQSTGWLRYAAYLSGRWTRDELSPGDAEDFARVGVGHRWRQILALAAANHRPAALQDLWPLFWVVALSVDGPELAERLGRLAPLGGESERPGEDIARSADLDLIRLIAGRGRVGTPLAALEQQLARERRAAATNPPHGASPDPADAAWTDRYARALAGRLATLADQIAATVVNALLGDRPDPGRWRVLEPLLARQARVERALVDALAGRLRTGDRGWLTLGLPPRVLAALTALPELRWIDAIAIATGLPHGRPEPERLGEVLVDTAGAGPLPQALAGELLPLLAGWSAPQVDRLAQVLWRRAPHLATDLYRQIAGRRDTALLRDELLRCSEGELRRLETALSVLGHGSRQQLPGAGAPQAWPPPQLPPAVPPASGGRGSGAAESHAPEGGRRWRLPGRKRTEGEG